MHPVSQIPGYATDGMTYLVTSERSDVILSTTSPTMTEFGCPLAAISSTCCPLTATPGEHTHKLPRHLANEKKYFIALFTANEVFVFGHLCLLRRYDVCCYRMLL